jgi:exopolyphosphatase/guanosine-5'-triphosphate,3'-diphosphate pyrophosphatase
MKEEGVMYKLGAIDIGTNSMRMLIATIENKNIVQSFKDLVTTRMGENVDKTGRLSAAAMDRNIEALNKFMAIAKKEGLAQIPIIATSAVRDAANKEVFLERAEKEAHAKIEVITGDREAELGFLGVIRGLKEKEENILVVDIGGGSTEFIFGNEAGIQHLVSVNMGAVRMTEKFVSTDPIAPQEKEMLIKEVDTILASSIHMFHQVPIDRVIGIGGTATTIAAVAKELKVYNRNEIHNYDLSHKQVRNILHQFCSKSIKQRKEMPGLHPKRADIITAGAIILNRILSLLDKESIRISEYDNLEGLVFEQIDKK